ncbi:MAG: LacI family DNA-binding transcriptional regulator [Burkholderia sp.]|nr:LacI family DNA-binding transcriptional regulator [Burkholderia sp.]
MRSEDLNSELLSDPKRRSGSVTLADVAKVAGVSKITASRALSNPKVVSLETQRRVREAVVKTGYVPNLLAGGLKSNRSRLIACLVPAISSGTAFLVAMQAMTEAFAEAGYQVMLGQRGYDQSREEMMVDAVIARRPDGIVLMGVLESEAAKRRLKATGVPIVETWDMSEAPIDMLVGFSHPQVGAASAEYLHRKGRRKLALITAANDPRARARGRGFLDAARRLGLADDSAQGIPTYTFVAPSRMAHGREGLRRLMETRPDIDAVYCATDLVALGALIEADVQGVIVPDQLAVIGFGDLDFAVDTHPALTTAHIDSVEIGRRAAALIVGRVEGHTGLQPLVDVGFTIVERGSA